MQIKESESSVNSPEESSLNQAILKYINIEERVLKKLPYRTAADPKTNPRASPPPTITILRLPIFPVSQPSLPPLLSPIIPLKHPPKLVIN